MESVRHISRQELARRWGVSTRTIDRKRIKGIIPWLDVSAGIGRRPLVRFRLADVEKLETEMIQDISKTV